MSLVTRPPTPEEVAGYEYKHPKRICIKPGMNGLWQVSGRNDIRDVEEVDRLDYRVQRPMELVGGRKNPDEDIPVAAGAERGGAY